MLANTVSPPVNRAVITGKNWARTTNGRICLQTSDNVWVQRGNVSALRSHEI